MKHQNQRSNHEIIDSYDYLGGTCSSTDYTGLIPFGISSKDEREAYEELYPFRPYASDSLQEIRLPASSNVSTSIPKEFPSHSQKPQKS